MSRRVIVTGASRGIGRAIARRLTGDGWTVFNLDLAPPDGGDGVRWLRVDLADPDAIERVIGELRDEGPITGLVNNAALATADLLESAGNDDFDRSVAVNLRAPMVCARALAPGMREAGFGRIVNIASRAHLGKTHRTAYAATKGGLVSMTRVWALELARAGVTCNAIAPGPVRTALFERVNPPELPRTREIIDSIPAGRLGEPEDVANAVGFFFDERSAFVTGQVLYVCGGVTLARGGS